MVMNMKVREEILNRLKETERVRSRDFVDTKVHYFTPEERHKYGQVNRTLNKMLRLGELDKFRTGISVWYKLRTTL